MEETVSIEEIRDGFSSLGILGGNVVFHTSFKSFGRVEGGVEAYLRFLCRNFENILAPAFTFESSVPPPENDRPSRNGMDYSAPWKSPGRPFDPRTAPIDPRMGIIPRRIAELPDAKRSAHPWHSWIARGAHADELTRNHPWQISNLPLERLAARGGVVALIGVSIKYCTAMHVAEERSGRRPFIRWAVDEKGGIGRIRVGGCANWFEGMLPRLQSIFRSARIGSSWVQAAPLDILIKTTADLIRSDPQLACCSPACIKCRDALMGGPEDY